MHALVTGGAGFIGSNLSIALVRQGWKVTAVDCLTDYYDVEQKSRNLADVLLVGQQAGAAVDHVDLDLRHGDLRPYLDGVDVVFHQAGQPGVRASWDDFGSYIDHNVLVTQRLLDAVRGSSISRFVFASSSSVYGNAPTYPTRETSLPAPHSPYGVSKLAAEQLCGVYARNWDIPTVALRYFTVFGPRQRPDMAMHRIIRAALTGGSFPMFGDGGQVRDFTFVGDVVAANLAAATADVPPGTVVNVAGGGSSTLAEIIGIIQALTGTTVELDRRPAEAGDVIRTGGAIDEAQRLLGWEPVVGVAEGLAHQVGWHRQQLGIHDPLASTPACTTA